MPYGCDYLIIPAPRIEGQSTRMRPLRICIPRYYSPLRDLMRPPIPEPPPFGQEGFGHDPVLFLNPQPLPPGPDDVEGSWLEVLGAERGLGADISAVSTLAFLADRLLSPAMGKAKDKAIAALAEAVHHRLPEGVSLEMGGSGREVAAAE